MRSLEERFWPKVDQSGECWLWIGHVGNHGYGSIRPGGMAPSRGAHIVSWEMANGRPVAEGKQINHHCDVRNCVRPEHLYEGTQSQNMLDKYDRGRVEKIHGRETHCPQGHPYSGHNLIQRTRIAKSGRISNGRECRACGLAAVKAYRQNKRQFVP